MLRKCSYDADHAECQDNCINQGRYCAVDSISDKFSKTFKPRQACSAHALSPARSLRMTKGSAMRRALR